jgi:transmembrane sensor
MKPKGLVDLFKHVAEQQDAVLQQTAPDAAFRHELARRVERRREGAEPRPRRLALRTWLAVAALLPAIAWGATRLVSDDAGGEPLHFTVGGRSGMLQAWERAPSSEALAVEFSDGSTFRLAPEARARVLAVDARGAVLMIESGHVRADVMPRAGTPARWRVQSGPFEVEVKGTRFDVGWNPQSEEFSLRLFEGEVNISGCAFGAGLAMRAHQEVRASCRRPQFELRVVGDDRPTESNSDAAGAAAGQPTPEPPPPLDAPAFAPSNRPDRAEAAREAAQAAPSARATDASVRHRRWVELARRGRFAPAYELAEPVFEDECSRAHVGEVLLLADAARHTGHVDSARHAYQAVRKRASDTAAGATAAFELGRLALDDDPEAASHWFEVCLAERPHGPLAQAALDRSLEAAVRINDAGRLRRLAERYLEQSPDGPRADDARTILKGAESGQN